MSESKPATPTKHASRIGVDTRVPKDVRWPTVQDNRDTAAKHRPPKVRKLPARGM